MHNEYMKVKTVTQMIIEQINACEYQKTYDEFHSFQQTVNWAKTKELYGWKAFYFRMRIEKETYSWMVLEKTYLKFFRVFYSPTGLPLDYKCEKVVAEAYRYMKCWLKDNKGIMLLIEPYISEIPEVFKEFPLMKIEEISPYAKQEMMRRFYIKELAEEYTTTFNSFSKRVKYNIHKSKRFSLHVQPLCYEELDRFYCLLKMTAEKNGFTIRSMEYFKRLYTAFGDQIRFMMVSIDLCDSIRLLNMRMNDKKERLHRIMDRRKQEEMVVSIEQDRKEIEKMNVNIQEYGNHLDICAGMYITNSSTKEVIHMYGGNDARFIKYEGQYYLHDYMMKWATAEGFIAYNFFGCENNGRILDQLLFMKEGFHVKCIETVGEYALVNDMNKVKLFYFLKHFYLRLSARYASIKTQKMTL